MHLGALQRRLSEGKEMLNIPWILRSKWRLAATVLVTVVLPIVILIVLMLFRVEDFLEEKTIARNALIARLSGQIVQKRFKGFIAYTESYARRPCIAKHITGKDWNATYNDIEDLVTHNPEIDRAFITDTNGVLRADFPVRKEVHGKDFSYRDWYKGVTREHKPYISEIYQRAADPKKYVTAIAVPIKDRLQQVIGYLVAQYTFNDLLAWIEKIKTVVGVAIILIDQHGQIIKINHDGGGANAPLSMLKYPDLINVSRIKKDGWLKKYDDKSADTMLINYTVMNDIGWIAVTEQPQSNVFELVGKLNEIVFWSMVVVFLVLVFMFFRWLDSFRRYDQMQKRYADDLVTTKAGLETSVQERTKQLKDAVSIRDEFLYIASHELKTPLTPLMMQIQLITRMLHDITPAVYPKIENLRKLIKTCSQELTRLSDLVGDTLDVARISAGRFSLQIKQVDLSELARGVVTRYMPVLIELCIEVKLSADKAVVGEWDQLRIDQVIDNLLSNALKYGSGKPIEISIFHSAEKAVLSIQDHGIGIASENHERIFHRFERAVSSKHYSGMGLGLYITDQIVSAHGGTIRVESQSGVGSCFIVELPLQAPQR
mgnify:FL=1